MAWKQDLSRLKKTFQEEATPPAPEKPKPKPAAPIRPLEDEDAVFLAAMGQRPARTPVAKVEPEAAVFEQGMAELMAPRRSKVPEPAPAPPAAPVQAREPHTEDVPPAAMAGEEPEEPEDFLSVMQGMKGVKAVGGRRANEKVKAAALHPTSSAAPDGVPPSPAEAPVVEAAVEAVPEVVLETVIAPTLTAGAASLAPEPAHPVLIQLAAGMAVEVDGVLDLRGHSVVDARERLEERLQDGRFLGWRTLHVMLGSDPELAGMFEAFLQAVDIRHLSRYALAPIPMGGAQARILYLVQA